MAILYTLGAIAAWFGICCGIASVLAWVFLYLNGEIAEDDKMLGDWPNVPGEMRKTATREGRRGELAAEQSGRPSVTHMVIAHDGTGL